MNTESSLNQVEALLASASQELSRLDRLTESAATSQKTIEKLTADIADLHGNIADLEPKARASKLTNAQALLALERSDLATIQGKITAQRSRVLAVGNDAATQIQIVRDRLYLKRRENIEAWIRDEFVINRIPCPISVLVENHRSVIGVKSLVASNDYYWMGKGVDSKIEALRELPRRFAELRPLAESEAGLVLATEQPEEEPAAEVPVSAVAELVEV